MKTKKTAGGWAIAGLALAGIAGADMAALRGTIRVDGSSTVFPITEAVAEEFGAVARGVRVTVGISGTGGGFKRFCVGETDINDASRPIQSKEASTAQERGITFIELPVAFDGLSVVVNPSNSFVDHLTVAELRAIWEPSSTVRTWRDVRPAWPDREIKLYGPGTDSGTFDYFTEVICGRAQASRADYTASEDDNTLVQGVAGDADALGYFGYAYYVANREQLKVVPIDGGNGPVTPSEETIRTGTYAPLSRPIFIYVSGEASRRPEVAGFVEFYLEHVGELATEVGYIALPETVYALARARFADRVTGTVYGRGSAGRSLEELFARR
ncbi:MAG: PstS family phosphate ABC transporter substrate-binding protein [Planctomycetes bacterium]|nr:PstS family phosphate ABC transporter substrate-binding protein [Planctomycetota bacterium]